MLHSEWISRPRVRPHSVGGCAITDKSRPVHNRGARLFPSTAQDESLLLETAADYKRVYPWVDEEAIGVNLAVHACYWAAKEAETKIYLSLGLGRTAGRFTVLRALYLSDEHRLTQNEIATKLRISSATVTFLVDGLEKDGLVTRLANQADRRSVYVELTPSGEEVCTRLVPAIARLAAQFSHGLSSEEKATLLRLLMKWRENAMISDAQAEELTQA